MRKQLQKLQRCSAKCPRSHCGRPPPDRPAPLRHPEAAELAAAATASGTLRSCRSCRSWGFTTVDVADVSQRRSVAHGQRLAPLILQPLELSALAMAAA